MERIADVANRYRVTEAEQRQWLQSLLDRVQAELEVRKVAQTPAQSTPAPTKPLANRHHVARSS